MSIGHLLLDGKEVPRLEGIVHSIEQSGHITYFRVERNDGVKVAGGADPFRSAAHPLSIREGDEVIVYQNPAEKMVLHILGLQVIKDGKAVYRYQQKTEMTEEYDQVTGGLTWSDTKYSGEDNE